MAGGYGVVNPGPAAGCGVSPAPVGGLLGLKNSWIWIIILLVFILPRLGFGGCGGLGGVFGGTSWLWILILIAVIFLVPGILPGFRLGGFAI